MTSRLSSLCRNVLRRDRVERDLDDELRATTALKVSGRVTGSRGSLRTRNALVAVQVALALTTCRLRADGTELLAADARRSWRPTLPMC
jgi:hypothetical protein